MAAKGGASFESILGDLKNRIYSPVYLLYGDEPYFIDEISGYIEKNALSDLEKEFNQMVVYGKDTDVPTLISYARRFPMMSNYQVILVKEAQDIDKIEELQPYVENPVPSTILVISYKYDKIDKRKSFYKAVDKTGVVFESVRMYDNKVPDWIHEYLGKRDYRISPKACFLLTEFLGTELGKIVNEISKLTINVPPGSEITEEYIEQNIGISKDYNVFELQKALGQNDAFKAQRIVRHFAANPKENPLVKIIPILYGYFSKLLIYHTLTDKSKNNVAAALSINPFFVQDYQVAARNYSVARLVKVISVFREYDLKAKGVDNVSIPDGELMREMVYRILH
jgi:DNA polymerase III subunit delta